MHSLIRVVNRVNTAYKKGCNECNVFIECIIYNVNVRLYTETIIYNLYGGLYTGCTTVYKKDCIMDVCNLQEGLYTGCTQCIRRVVYWMYNSV